MSYAHRLQGSRFELKYIIPEALVRPLREFASSYLVPDEHARPERNWEYDVHSLYMDSPSLTLYYATVRGLKNRFKLRVRFYDRSAEKGPMFFEIKRRANDVILKQRARVRRESADRLIAGGWPQRSDLVGDSDGEFGALERFCSLRDMITARGRAFVSYIREAYVTPNDNTVRMTLDRAIHGLPFRDALPMPPPQEAAYPAVEGIVLELKFTDRFPNWMREMVEVFNLERRSMAKYVQCMQALSRRPLAFSRPVRAGMEEIPT